MISEKEIINRFIEIQIQFYSMRSNIREILNKDRVLLALIDCYVEPIDNITEIILKDILEIKDKDKYLVMKDIINNTVKNGWEYKDACIDLIINHKDLLKNINKVSFYNGYKVNELLEEHQHNYPTHRKQLKERT